jgi:Arc/MetJ-type ribon-helix-helix transcriptional regulator
MPKLIHIKTTKRMEKRMRYLIEIGLFSNQAEIVREGIREILLKYKKIQKK